MKKIRIAIVSLGIGFSVSSFVSGAINLNQPLNCNFQFGQYMDLVNAESDSQKSQMEWNFFDLFGKSPSFLSAGDTGPVLVHHHDQNKGITVWLGQGNGGHMFTMWPDGSAFWSKQNDLVGTKNVQQFRGVCFNIRSTK